MKNFTNTKLEQNKGYLFCDFREAQAPIILWKDILRIIIRTLDMRGQGAGIGDRKILMSNLVKYALLTKRLPVVPKLFLHPMHNFGRKVSGMKMWERYFDMENITAILRRKNGEVITQKKIRVLTIGCFLKEAWHLILFGKIRAIGNVGSVLNNINSKKNNTKILVGSMNFDSSQKLRVSNFNLIMDIHTPPSERVISIALRVIDKLKVDGNFYALHVRRGDKIKENYKGFDKDTRPNAIMKKIKNVFPEGANIYILTDEWDRTFFDPLKSKYRIFRYFDFPELTELIECKKPDNFLLYSVERHILNKATKRVLTFHEGSVIDHDTNSYLVNLTRGEAFAKCPQYLINNSI